MKIKISYLKLVVLSVLIILLASTATSGMIKINNKNAKNVDLFDPPIGILDDPVYEWVDNFNNEQLIESSMSYDYELVNNKARIKSTYSIWTDSDWTCMKKITLNNNIGTQPNYALKLTVNYDSDMDNNYADVRFKHEDYPTQFLDYWIEEYDTSSAIFWVNIPSIPGGSSNMYMFYGNPSATSQSDFYSVFSEWEPEYANDDKVTTHIYTEGAWDPDVAYGSNKFLVVWEEGEAPYPPYTLFFKQDIRGSLYNKDGSPVSGAQDFTIRSGSGLKWHHENPSVAYGSGKFFVAWEHYYTSNDATTMNIKAKLITPSGGVGNEITICEADNCQADPHVSYDNVNNRFCVLWEDARSGMTNYDIYGKLYDSSGNQVGSEKVIVNTANSQCEPWAAFDPIHQQYMIVWEEGIDAAEGPFDLFMGLFDKNLNCIGPGSGNSPVKIADGNSGVDYNFPCVAFCQENERFLVTYNDGDISNDDWWGNVWGKVFDSAGNIAVDTFLIRSGEFVRTDIAPYLSTNFLVAFNGGNNIWGRFVGSEDGSIYNGDIKLSSSTSAEADWVNMATSGDEIFVCWEDERIDYAPPFDMMPDVYANLWHLNIGDSSDVSVSFGSEKNIILEAQITSKLIEPENLFRWEEFIATSQGSNLEFDILDSTGTIISGYHDISSGKDISGINQDVIRLRVKMSRNDPSYSPTLDKWKVTYIGQDDEPPRTTVDHIDGTRGLNNWYIEEGVTIWLKSQDFPEQTGSGIETTYYKVDNSPEEIYNEESGIHLTATQSSNWMGDWTVVFWSVDVAGNVESHGDPEHRVDIKIDAERPYVEIRQPVNEQKVETPFIMTAYAVDNAAIERVEFDIEPFGERDNAPYPPDGFDPATDEYWWECDVGPKSVVRPLGTTDKGINVMIRAQVFDESGQTWLHEIWVWVENWGGGGKSKILTGLYRIIDSLKLKLQIENTMKVEVSTIDDADTMEFTAEKVLTGEKTTTYDYDLSDGGQGVFNVPTGLYRIISTAYKDEEILRSSMVSRILFIKR